MGNAIGVQYEDSDGNQRSMMALVMDPAALCIQAKTIEDFHYPEVDVVGGDASEDTDEPFAPEVGADDAPMPVDMDAPPEQ
mmetsp:Transcript_3282/g.5755  ORF Transcript_3282/g.5755 Transcript_3282/m.5755 type:complete len:81 (-) Transcript_3282:139-381(-)|eukprot:CAMPEP_0182442096 /NCGR_PEP_ID=MMETSP1172-20130603/1062_1 /TAXON_ID=708627 /ORGANISM="Timspurckia oligopyrenoides, Strain CCMP3278" /LENGTH=80 /DNA_ID=CAMNT_0024636793 /DNA_START=146 /DNA_END=388 /DNA_ORIENTATION=+